MDGSDSSKVCTLTWDVSSYDGYENFTEDNFIVSNYSAGGGWTGGGRNTSSTLVSYEYIPETGTLKADFKISVTGQFYHDISVEAWVIH